MIERETFSAYNDEPEPYHGILVRMNEWRRGHRDVVILGLQWGGNPGGLWCEVTFETPEVEGEFSNSQILDAIDKFLEYGEESFVENKTPGAIGQAGYFSRDGWAARCLRYHRDKLQGK